MQIYFKNPSIDVRYTDNQNITITVPFKNGFRSFESNIAIDNFLTSLPSEITREKLIESITKFFKVAEQNAVDILDNHLLKSHLMLTFANGTIQEKKSNGVLLVRKQLLSANIVNHISWLFTGLCNKNAVILLASISVLFQLWFLTYVGITQVFEDNLNAKPATALILIFGGLFFHEFGHTASAFRFGCRKVTIGCGWYIIYFVMLADLAEAWALERRKRILISLAGGYFQSIYILLLGIIWTLYDSSSCLAAITALTIYNIFNLNPFFRMDGYWIVSDWLNIKNLRQVAGNHARSLIFSPQNIKKTLSENRLSLNVYTLSLLVFIPLFYGYFFIELVPFSFGYMKLEFSTMIYNSKNYQLGYNLIFLFFNIMILLFASKVLFTLSVKLWQYSKTLLKV